MSKPHIMFVAGETSGDHHAAALIRALKGRAACFGLGGPAMQAAGLRLDLDLASRSVIGFVEVLKHLGFFRRAFAQAQQLLSDERPDLLVLVDYPGFNLRLAAKAKAMGVPVAYYISPQVWAWKRGRVPVMARLLKKMLVTFPFEKAIYDEAGLDCSFVGNPLLDAIPAPCLGTGLDKARATRRNTRMALGWKGHGPWIGLLPGSREQELRWLLPVMLRAAQRLWAQDPLRHFVVIKPPQAPKEWYAAAEEAAAGGLPLRIFEGKNAAQSYIARSALDAAMVASGTATLETALIGTPFCILYRVHPLSYMIGKRLVKIHSIGLANVVAGRRVVPEFLQSGLDPEAIAAEIDALLKEPERRRAQAQGLAEGLASLGKPGVARRAANELMALVQP